MDREKLIFRVCCEYLKRLLESLGEKNSSQKLRMTEKLLSKKNYMNLIETWSKNLLSVSTLQWAPRVT